MERERERWEVGETYESCARAARVVRACWALCLGVGGNALDPFLMRARDESEDNKKSKSNARMCKKIAPVARGLLRHCILL